MYFKGLIGSGLKILSIVINYMYFKGLISSYGFRIMINFFIYFKGLIDS